MGRAVDSDALVQVGRQLGISGQAGQFTDFEEDSLTQVYEANSAIRRGRADIATGGWFFGILENVHSSGDSEVSNIDPYEAGIFAAGSFPQIVDPRYDIWIEGVSVEQISGTGDADHLLELLLPARFMAWGKDDAGVAVAATAKAHAVASWNGLFPASGPNIWAVNGRTATQQDAHIPLGFRMPRGGAFLQFSSLSTAASEWQMCIIMGLFPIGMGSDAARW